jgi:ABC-2 type transport system ATP-binding protein
LEEVEQLCQHAAIIKNGEIIANDRVKNLVKFVDQETYVIHVDHVTALDQLKDCNPRTIDENTFEVELNKSARLNDFILRLTSLGMTVVDLRPKGNRLEKIYLKLLKQ